MVPVSGDLLNQPEEAEPNYAKWKRVSISPVMSFFNITFDKNLAIKLFMLQMQKNLSQD